MPFRIFWDPHPANDTKKQSAEGRAVFWLCMEKWCCSAISRVRISSRSLLIILLYRAADRLRKRDSRLEDSGVTSGEFTDHEPAASGSGGLRQNTAGTDISIKCMVTLYHCFWTIAHNVINQLVLISTRNGLWQDKASSLFLVKGIRIDLLLFSLFFSLQWCTLFMSKTVFMLFYARMLQVVSLTLMRWVTAGSVRWERIPALCYPGQNHHLPCQGTKLQWNLFRTKDLCDNLHLVHSCRLSFMFFTVCPRNSDPFYTVIY